MRKKLSRVYKRYSLFFIQNRNFLNKYECVYNFITDAKTVASSFDCKYTETSGALNHNVDELLVGILKQIRLKLAEKVRFSCGGRRRRLPGNLSIPGSGNNKSPATRRKSAGIRVRGILDKVLGNNSSKSKSCDDLHVL